MGEVRVGLGWDVHRFVAGLPLILGGVTIRSESGLEGYSDGDILLHAITDALLGAAALDDIGTYFPSNHETPKGASSSQFLEFAAKLVHEQGYIISNVDTTVILEKPQLSEYRLQIRESVAHLLIIEIDRVSVKFKTADKIGPVGEGISAEAQAIVMLSR